MVEQERRTETQIALFAVDRFYSLPLLASSVLLGRGFICFSCIGVCAVLPGCVTFILFAEVGYEGEFRCWPGFGVIYPSSHSDSRMWCELERD